MKRSDFYPLGTRIGHYEIASRPLIGEMGIVYLCFNLQEGRPVALKTFKPEYLPNRAARDRFLREGTAWVDLGAHPHVVRCYDVLYIDPKVYLVLELVAKEPDRDDASLRAWLTPGQPLPLDQALLFALQIARGMGHAAATLPGFVHRDLKPENVLVGADKVSGVNRLRVTDFGLGAVLQGVAPQTSEVFKTSEVSAGTSLYMAPEQWRGEPVGVYTDVYALGCILYEMVSGQQAAAGESLSALRHAHCEGDLRPLPPDLPEPLRAFLTRCLALAPEERYGDWAQVEAALASAYEALVGRPAPEAASAVDLSREERVAAGWSYNAMGNAYRDIGKAEVAVDYFERARSVGSAEGARELQGAALGNLGNAYADLGDAQRAMGYFEQRLEIAREIGAASQNAAERTAARRGEGNALMGLGLAYADLGDARRAIEYYEQALVIHREICAASQSAAERAAARRGEGTVLGNLGSAYLQLGDARRAIGYYEQRLEIAREIGDRRGEGTVLGNLGSAYLQLGDARCAIGYYAQRLEIAREIGDRRGEGHALGNLGNACLQLGDARRAIGYYEQRLEIAHEVGDRRGEGNALMGLGLAYAALGDARRAIGYYEQCLSIHREIGDRREEANALGNLGSAHLKLGEKRRAMEYYEQALVMDREIGDIAGAAADSFNMARLYAQQDEKARALELAQEAARIYTQIGHAQYAHHAQKLIAQLRGRGTLRRGPSSDQILQQFDQIIKAVVAAAHGHRQARAAVEGLFDQFEQGNWRIVGPIQRIWAGERDEVALTAGIDSNSTLIVREILRRLGA